MEVWLFIASAVLIPIALAEVSDWMPKLSVRLTQWAASRLGNLGLTNRYAEEWEAELNLLPGRYSKLSYAFSRLFYLRSIRNGDWSAGGG